VPASTAVPWSNNGQHGPQPSLLCTLLPCWVSRALVTESRLPERRSSSTAQHSQGRRAPIQPSSTPNHTTAEPGSGTRRGAAAASAIFQRSTCLLLLAAPLYGAGQLKSCGLYRVWSATCRIDRIVRVTRPSRCWSRSASLCLGNLKVSGCSTALFDRWR
jgi:hypothetical protein